MYIEGKYINGIDDLSVIYELRNTVLGDTHCNPAQYFNMDTRMICDEMAIHAVAKVEGKIVGCATLFYDGEVYLIDGVSVLEEERRKKYGDFLVRMLVDRAFQNQASSIVSYVPENIVPFFSSIGFEAKEQNDSVVRCELYRGGLCRECSRL